MNYDQSWMGYGWVGGAEAGAISLAAGLLLYFAFHRYGRRNGWSDARQIGWSYVLALALTGCTTKIVNNQSGSDHQKPASAQTMTDSSTLAAMKGQPSRARMGWG